MVNNPPSHSRVPGLLRRADIWLFLGLWLGLMVLGRSRLLRDPDTLWHTMAGYKFFETRRFLATDTFSFTFFGKPWTPYEWLAECVMAALHAVGGLDALLVATVTTLTGLYAWVAQRLMRSGLHIIPSLLVLILAFAAGAANLHVRPSIVTIALLGTLFAWLIDFEAGRIGVTRLFWMIPLFLVWTNSHGGMLGGFATLALFTVAWGLPRLAGPRRRDALLMMALTTACGLTAFLNPYGASLPRTWLQIMTSPVLPRLIVEHRPPDPSRGEFWIVLLPGLAYAGVLASTFPRRPRVVWLIPLVWLALSLSRVRHGSLFGITVALALADLLPQSRLGAWLARPGRDLFRFRSADDRIKASCRPVMIPLALFLAVLMIQATGIRAPIVGRGWARLDPTYWPLDLLSDLRHLEAEAGGEGRIFNDYLYGGFLIYHTPGLKVFIDGRCELYGDAWLEQYDDGEMKNPSLLDTWADRYRFNLALVKAESKFDLYLSKAVGWTLVRHAGPASLYRRNPTNELR